MKKVLLSLTAIAGLMILYFVSESSVQTIELRSELQRNISSKSASMLPAKPFNSGTWVKPSGRTVLEVANDFLEKNRDKLQLQEHHTLKPIVFRTPLRNTVNFSVLEEGIPLVGIDIRVQLDRELNLVKVGGSYRPLEPADLSQLGSVDAQAVAELLPVQYKVLKAELSDAKPILFATTNTERPELSFVIQVKDRARFAGHKFAVKNVVVRASDGQILATTFPRREFSYTNE